MRLSQTVVKLVQTLACLRVVSITQIRRLESLINTTIQRIPPLNIYTRVIRIRSLRLKVSLMSISSYGCVYRCFRPSVSFMVLSMVISKSVISLLSILSRITRCRRSTRRSPLSLARKVITARRISFQGNCISR